MKRGIELEKAAANRSYKVRSGAEALWLLFAPKFEWAQIKGGFRLMCFPKRGPVAQLVRAHA